ncbi:hypothetical protein ACFFX0_26500 [Citricoccus parietis]|uniref:Secreted protein n=1 Tax=Citricoccus parietis TaxID=592307 RepID=A0ABV5G805_9MICC
MASPVGLCWRPWRGRCTPLWTCAASRGSPRTRWCRSRNRSPASRCAWGTEPATGRARRVSAGAGHRLCRASTSGSRGPRPRAPRRSARPTAPRPPRRRGRAAGTEPGSGPRVGAGGW